MAIGAVALLALVAKAKAVFESPGTFLSFPVVSPLTYRAEQLRFGGAGEMTPDDLNELSEFSRIVNCIPRSVFAPVDQLEYMWNVYNDVLQTAEVARGALTSEEQARYEQAVALLYVNTADAGRSDSDVLRVYKQHRDASIAAQEAFTARQLGANPRTIRPSRIIGRRRKNPSSGRRSTRSTRPGRPRDTGPRSTPRSPSRKRSPRAHPLARGPTGRRPS